MSSKRRWPAVLCALTVLMAGVGHVHAHLCFDGQEPAAAIHSHATDGGAHEHHDLEHDTDHDDRDVDLQGQAALKSLGYDLPGMPATAARHFMPAAGAQAVSALDHEPMSRGSPPFARPLLRGPPTDNV